MGRNDPLLEDALLASLRALMIKHASPELAATAVLCMRMSSSLPDILHRVVDGSLSTYAITEEINKISVSLPNALLLADAESVSKLLIELVPQAYIHSTK